MNFSSFASRSWTSEPPARAKRRACFSRSTSGRCSLPAASRAVVSTAPFNTMTSVTPPSSATMLNSVPRSTTLTLGFETRNPTASAGTLALSMPRCKTASHAESRSSVAGPSSVTCAPQSKVISAKPDSSLSCWPRCNSSPGRRAGPDQWQSLAPESRAIPLVGLLRGLGEFGAAGRVRDAVPRPPKPKGEHNGSRRGQRTESPNPRRRADNARLGGGKIRRLGLHLARVLHEARRQRESAHVKAARLFRGEQQAREAGALRSGDDAIDQRVAERIEFEQFGIAEAHAAPSSES